MGFICVNGASLTVRNISSSTSSSSMVGLSALILRMCRHMPQCPHDLADAAGRRGVVLKMQHRVDIQQRFSSAVALQPASTHISYCGSAVSSSNSSSSSSGISRNNKNSGDNLPQQPCRSRTFSSSSSSSDERQAISTGVDTPSTAAAAAAVTPAPGASQPVRPHSSLDKKEAAKFAALADQWWDKASGPFAPLHALNAARCSFLRTSVCSLRGLPQHHAEPLQGLRVLDVGCGGGLLSEPLARMGASVHGIDVSDEGVAAAAAHAAGDPLTSERIRYQKTTLEQLVASGASYDLVMASEVIEHVRRPQQFMADLAAATRPGGQVFVTTLNRTPASYALAIVAAEYVLGFVPRGTHDWARFITPQELAMMATDAALKVELLAGMSLNPASGRFSLGDDMSVNYAALLSKPAAVHDA